MDEQQLSLERLVAPWAEGARDEAPGASSGIPNNSDGAEGSK
jgi:hypothetical protein